MIKAITTFLHRYLHRKQIDIQNKADQIYSDFVKRLQTSYLKVMSYKKNIIPQQKIQKVLNSSANQIADMLDVQQITSVQLLFIFIQRAYYIGKQLHLICDQLFQDAYELAVKYDKIRAEQKKKNYKFGRKRNECFPPFFGIPLSVKSSFPLKNKVTFVGVVNTQKNYSTQDCLFVSISREMGFIPFIKTNIPQLNKSFQTHNNIYGRAQNPWNRQRTNGGSSGGQGGLIACGGSCFGLGSDIGGSARIPSTFNGLYTLLGQRSQKKSHAFYGKFSMGALLNIRASLCPITKSVEDIALFFNQILDQNNYKNINKKYIDQYLINKKFDIQQYTIKKKLKFGYYTDSPFLKIAESQRRAVLQTVKILEDLGHEVKKIELPQFTFDIFKYFFKLLFGDGKNGSLQLFLGQNISPQLKMVQILSNSPIFLKKIVYFILKLVSPRRANLLEVFLGLSIFQLFYQNYKFEELKQKFYEFWIDSDIELLITPGFPLPAFKHTQCGQMTITLIFVSIWNTLQYPSGAIPVSVAKWNEQYYQENNFNDSISKTLKQNIMGSAGLPVGVQIVGLPHSEQIILNVMKQLQQEIGFRKKHPYPLLKLEEIR